ncbi:HAMP domain-containing histidine kinase [Clostridium sp. PL3]|uniref:histidine kinase n=1 Tax=Clostridium thailandense TaxID=2794346 RepID=A0A949TU37_9CLOT|nr:HAMP domain-containing sensor histidine kinase [Clostridium thailandense]MBV7272408.1 HAMP domain-containing histidine kinase [Clostridium thailandense]
MFKQLRNKFLMLNLIIISIMMVISFTSIYLITYRSVHNDITLEMNRLLEAKGKPNKEPKRSNINGSNSNDEKHSFERSASFILIMNNNNNLLSHSSTFDMNEEFYKTASEKALNLKADRGSFELDDTYWEFMRKPSSEESVYKLIFLDVTDRYNYLTNLIYTFAAVAFIMLIVIFFISRFFANKAIKPIKETFDKQEQFIADASHELKTPLAVINTNTDVLLANSEDTISNQSKWIYYIKSEVHRMTKLTNDLLYLAQADNSDIRLISTDFNLSEAVENIILTMEASIFESNLLLDYDITPEIICHGNSEKLKQVVMILLDNALKYTNSHGKISLELKKYNNKAVMTFSNTGKGIPENDIKHIFDRFYRIDKSRSKNSGGYGLGLAIAKSIVEQHKGRIYAKSIINTITTFTVELPLAVNR